MNHISSAAMLEKLRIRKEGMLLGYISHVAMLNG